MKQLISSVFDSFSKQIHGLGKVYVPICSIIFSVWLIEKFSRISVYELVADSNEIGRIAPYAGAVSNFGLLLLCCAASICFFSSYLIDANNKHDEKWKLFFKCSGYFVLLLLIDDTFQLHENFSTLLFGADANISVTDHKLQNILEATVFTLYVSLFFFYGFYFRKLIYRTEILVLILALVFFFMSLVVDVLPENMKGHYILEEGFKLLGIASLMTYYVKACYQKAKKLL
ncbi:hypothetical protein C7B62_09005 [Pleurocapsa sp. CCALA 161]|uniref:hypothetical protein n=1 Tax=Pleurocapsa sp. CCALA 161 TaxID=2107688 RepID=UPI000D051014|nr:hypothetical protein [Pleurocapsa sp. CCALA 161]PSB10597.1 hypothetical protein C7B62_09005 [Pleurocapsa sp. CCALA 161]